MNKEKKWILVFGIALILLIFQSGDGIAQSLTGTTGLVTIPTAEMPKDGEISFGLNWSNRKSFLNSTKNYSGFISLGYLPFIEISGRLTRCLNLPKEMGIGDRMASIRLRPFIENAFFPSVVLGVHDLVGTRTFHASYLAISKSFCPSGIGMNIHLGYGVDWIEADRHQFVGLFGGISLSPKEFITLMLEYDAEKFNCGVRLFILNHLELLVALLDFDTFSGGIRYKFQL